MIKLVEVKKINDFNVSERKRKTHYELGEIWINPDSILQIKADGAMKKNLSSGYLPSDLDSRQEFSKIQFGSGNNIAAGYGCGVAISIGREDIRYQQTITQRLKIFLLDISK